MLPAIHRASGVIQSFPEDHSQARDNLWILGGEIIRDLNGTPSLRKVPVEQLLCDVIDDDGGPLRRDR